MPMNSWSTDGVFSRCPHGLPMANLETCRFGVLTASDRASKGEYDDLSGPTIESFLEEALTSEWEIERRLVEDERESIEAALIDLIDNCGCSVVVTTGGTGPSQRDVTPEATQNICEKILPGFGEQMRAVSMRHVPTAMLSRQMAGIRGSSLVINLPGAPRSIREILDSVFAAVPYCVDLIGGPYITTDSEVVDSFRPPHARRE